VHLIARSDKSGSLPDDLARDCLARDCLALVRALVAPHFGGIAPALAGAIELAEDRVQPPGSGPVHTPRSR